MNQTNFIQFKKERDLGTIITDTFKFLRQEWKPFFTTIFKTSIIPILLAIAAIIFFTISFSDVFSMFLSTNETGFETNFGMFFLYFAFVMVFYLIAYVMITASAMYYIKSYVDNEGLIDYQYINDKTKERFWAFAGLFVLTFCIIFVGAFFCFFPAVYFGIVLSLATSILVFFDNNPIDSIGESFRFIKGHWWETFGILLVVTLLVGVLNYISQVPATIYQLVKMGISLGSQDPTQVFSLFKDPVYLSLLVISYLIRFFLYTISLIATVFVFFDINEQKNASGSIEMIDSIGK